MRQQQPEKAGIGSELDQRFDDIFGTILKQARELEDSVQADLVRNQRQSGQLFVGIVLVWMFIVISAAWGLLYREQRRKASEDALLLANQKLLSQAEELKGHREHLTELVDARTKELTSSNARLTLEIAERVQTETALKDSQTQLRYLSSRLLSAQEEERKKVSRELHDDLGQSLTLMKFQLRSVRKTITGRSGRAPRGVREHPEVYQYGHRKRAQAFAGPVPAHS